MGRKFESSRNYYKPKSESLPKRHKLRGLRENRFLPKNTYRRESLRVRRNTRGKLDRYRQINFRTYRESINPKANAIGDYMSRIARPRSSGYCLRYVKYGLAHITGTSKASWPGGAAKEYYNGKLLARAGYKEISKTGYTPTVGDIVVFNTPGRYGHIQVLGRTGRKSDFHQRSFIPGRRYYGKNVGVKFFRIA